jgi:hypothetical protein
MKKLLLLLLTLTLSASAFAQTIATTTDGKEVLLKEDGTYQYLESTPRTQNTPTPTDTKFIWVNGYDKLVDVEFTYGIKDELEPALLADIISKTMYSAQYRCKNKLSFVPIKLIITQTEKGSQIKSAVSAYAKNTYGAEGEVKFFASVRFTSDSDAGFYIDKE